MYKAKPKNNKWQLIAFIVMATFIIGGYTYWKLNQAPLPQWSTKFSQTGDGNIDVGFKREDALDLFYDSQFLNIQTSLIKKDDLATQRQLKAEYRLTLEPPQNIKVSDSRNGKSVVLRWDYSTNRVPTELKIMRSVTDEASGQEIARIAGNLLGYYDFDIGAYLSFVICLLACPP